MSAVVSRNEEVQERPQIVRLVELHTSCPIQLSTEYHTREGDEMDRFV